MNLQEADRPYLAGLTVLYVEDDPQVRNLSAAFLRRRVGKLLLAEDGVQGLETFRNEAPHLVVTDIMMPRMDGLDMTEAIRAEAPGTPIVVTTAFEQTHFLMRSIALGVDSYVLKPVQPDLFEAALLRCAHQLRAEEELRRHERVERELLLARHHEALGILATGIAHDYNNLLQAILTSLETASLKVPTGSPAHQILGMSQRFADLAQHLGRQLLALGQAEGQFDHQGPLETLVEACVHKVLQVTGIGVTTTFAPGLPPVCYNRERLEQALEALLTNACEAMPEGGTLALSMDLQEVGLAALVGDPPPGTYLRVSLQDSGVGMSSALLPRIFDPYFSTKELGNKKGQGLGLALCRSIIQAHGGRITAESEAGRGSTFRIYLPVAGPELPET